MANDPRKEPTPAPEVEEMLAELEGREAAEQPGFSPSFPAAGNKLAPSFAASGTKTAPATTWPVRFRPRGAKGSSAPRWPVGLPASGGKEAPAPRRAGRGPSRGS